MHFAPAGVSYSYITNFTKTANVQTNLQLGFPMGLYTTTNALGTTFNITSDTNSHNFSEISGLNNKLVITNIGLSNVTTVYALMSAYSPLSGQLASVQFIGSGGATQLFVLSGGVDIRDFFVGSFQNTINGTTTQNAYITNGVRGAAGTGNTFTGLVGTYLLDEQIFTLTNLFLGQQLDTIVISNLNGSSTPFVIALTAQQVTAPIMVIQQTDAKNARLLWVDTPGGFHLQQNPLAATTNWVNNSNAVSLIGGIDRVSIPLSSNALFFRLTAP